MLELRDDVDKGKDFHKFINVQIEVRAQPPRKSQMLELWNFYRFTMSPKMEELTFI